MERLTAVNRHVPKLRRDRHEHIPYGLSSSVQSWRTNFDRIRYAVARGGGGEMIDLPAGTAYSPWSPYLTLGEITEGEIDRLFRDVVGALIDFGENADPDD